MQDILAQAAARAITYYAERDGWSVFPDSHAMEALQRFIEAMPVEGTDGEEVIRILDEVGGPGTVASSGGRYFGFVTGSAHPVGVAASWLAAAWDQNAAMGVMSPTAAVLDTVTGAWVASLFGLPPGTQTTFVSGTSAGNVACLAAGRDRLFADLGWDSINDGLIGAPPLRVVVSEAAHSSVSKALGLIGLGRDNVVRVPADDQGRMRASELPAAGEPTLVITQAGNVNSGAFDPFSEIADHFEGTPSWIHVDGAFGLWAAASPSTSYLTAGLDRADSWATDMHKWLNVTYDSAVAMVRKADDLARTFKVGAPYLPDSGRLDPVHRGPDMSQRARSIETWAVLKSLGRNGVTELIDRCCTLARRFAASLEAAGFTIHNDVVLNQVLVGLGNDEATTALVNHAATNPTMWAGGSVWNGSPVLRISVSSWATTEADVDAAVSELIALSQSLEGKT